MDEPKKPTDADSLDMRLDPAALENHPINAEVYRDVPDDEFVESVRQQGILQPIILAANARTVVAGHRRRQAAIIAKLPNVPVHIRRDLIDDLEIRKAALESNRNRVKTPEQIAREIEQWKRIRAEEADRKLSATTLPTHSGECCLTANQSSDQRGSGTKSKPVDLVGEAAVAVGVSRSTAVRAVAVGRAIDEAETAGQHELAKTIRSKETVGEAYRTAKGKKKPGKPRKKKEPPTVDDPTEFLKTMAKVIETERTKIDLVVKKFGPDAFADTALKDLDSGIIALRKWAQKFAKKEKK